MEERKHKEDAKAFDVVQAEVKDMLDTYFEKHQVPFAWEAKIMLDITSDALHDQFSAHEEDIIKMYGEVDALKSEIEALKEAQSETDSE